MDILLALALLGILYTTFQIINRGDIASPRDVLIHKDLIVSLGISLTALSIVAGSFVYTGYFDSTEVFPVTTNGDQEVNTKEERKYATPVPATVTGKIISGQNLNDYCDEMYVVTEGETTFLLRSSPDEPFTDTGKEGQSAAVTGDLYIPASEECAEADSVSSCDCERFIVVESILSQ